MKSIVFATCVAAVAAGGELALTWSDCGDASTHGKTTEIQPTSLVLGVDTAISGSGDVDKQISGGTFDLHLTAGGGLINSHFKGNNCEASSYNLPLGIGSLSWDGLACPVAVGDVKLGLHAKLSSNLPASLAKSHIELKALDQDGDAALCVDIDLAKQSELEAQARGAASMVAAFMDYLKNNLLKFDEQILDEIAEMGKVCTFRAPDGGRCGALVVQIMKHLLLGNHHQKHALETQMVGGAFVGGMMKGLLGDDTNYKACRANVGSVFGEVKQIAVDVKSRDFKAAISDISTVIGHIVNALKKHNSSLEAHDVQKGACVAAVNDLKLFTKVLKNGDVLGNLRKNWLEADAEILDYAGDMGKYCTFREPNGNKCGFRLGAITRDMIVGLEAATVV